MGPEKREQMVREEVQENEQRTVDELTREYENRSSSLSRRLAEADLECRPQIANIARVGYPPLDETFPDIECPTLVLKADADPEVRATELDIADELDDGRLVHIPEAGHCVFRDQYEAAYAELQAFLIRS
jgi:pimeloyl-ACP methyl ester carboxylesterase